MATTAKRKTKKTKRTVKAKAETQLRKRGSEALGFLLVLIGAAFAALLVTYMPADPSLSVATDVAAQNMLGVVGSYIADPLHKVLGWAAYGVPLALAVWGVRLVLHTADGTVRWGLPPGQEHAIEPNAQVKLGWLRQLAQRDAGLSTGGQIIDIYGPAPGTRQP